MATCRSSSKNTRKKMNLRPILDKNSPWAHTESKLDVLGVAKKLVKYVVHLSKRIFLRKNHLLIGCPKNKPLVFGLREFYGFKTT
jgi:hypothetical protein